MVELSRRQFVAAAAAGVAAGAAPAIRASQANKTYRTALIGSGWWGMNVLREALSSGACQAVAVCDVDADRLELAAEEIGELQSGTPKTYGDFRELLDREEVDIAIIATPDHWHVLNTVAALEHGAHVFVEKPTGHTVVESRALVEATRATGRTVQVGLHRRVGPHHVAAMEFLRSGAVGEIGAVRMFAFGGGGAERPSPNSQPPEGLDWEMYCGPAPLRPFNRKIHPGGFRNFLDFANGQLGDWGVHWLDQMLWWSEEEYPRRIFSSGGRPIRGPAVLTAEEQTTDAPDSQVAVYEFDNFTATWEHRQFGGNGAERTSIGCYFYGTEGMLHVGWRDGWTFYPSNGRKEVVHGDAQLQEPDGHNLTILWNDFLTAIREGRQPTCYAEIGHAATSLSLLGMLSYQLGRSIDWDGEAERIVGDEDANALLRREYRGPWEYPTA